jgi:hypothetical protein
MTNTLEKIYRIFDSIKPDECGCLIYPKAPSSIEFYIGIEIKGARFKAHRLVLERKLGRPIKPLFCALHICDNRSCVNPNHIYEGTYRDNMRDRVQRNPNSWNKWAVGN